MLLDPQFYDMDGELDWPSIVQHLEETTPEKKNRKAMIVLHRDAIFATRDIRIIIHGYKQCNLFWLAVCRLASRGYSHEVVVHESKAHFRSALGEHRSVKGFSVQHTTSPLVMIACRRESILYYVGGYTNVCSIL